MDYELPLNRQRAEDDSTSVTEGSLTGEVVTVVFCSEDGNYAVLRIVDTGGEERILVGTLGEIGVGENLRAWGSWEKHKTYGRQFRVSRYETVLPSSIDGMRRYLASGIIPGVGPKLADRIIDRFGEETMNVLQHYSARLCEVPGFGKNRLKQFREVWSEQSERRDTFIFLQGLGISPAYCERVYRKYGAETVEKVKENPYRMAQDIWGIGFRMADAAASHLDIARDHPFRLASGAIYVLDQRCTQDGHTCLPYDLLVEEAASVLEVDNELTRLGIARAEQDGAVVISREGLAAGDEMVYPASLFHAESDVAKRVKRLLEFPPEALDVDEIAPHGEMWERLNEAQRQAVGMVFQCPICIVTGGPGVGKTTVTREIVRVARSLKLRVSLAAPTGRAAKRLSEATMQPAQTIHRLLRWEPANRGFVHGVDNPLPVDLLVLDEVSMVDIMLGMHVLRAVALGTRVVLVGDSDQLPSVGPGSVLRDLLESRIVPMTHLHEVYRQGAESRIITVAHQVNRGIMPDLRPPPRDDELRDFYWIEQEEPERVVELITRMVAERIPARFGFSPMEDIQVLTPMNRGIVGAENLNRELQAVLNGDSEGNREALYIGETPYRDGDRVMQTVNNYEHGVFNGDLGLIIGVDNEDNRLTVLFDIGEVEYTKEDIHQLRLAYAMTIHKSQGSEFPVVIVPLLNQHYVMLRRNLVYTAITRPSKLLILLGSRKALSVAIGNFKQVPRFSRLCYRLQL